MYFLIIFTVIIVVIMSGLFSRIGAIFGAKPDAPVNEEYPEYDLKPVDTPRMAGTSLVMAVNMLETRGARSLLQNQILTKAGILGFRAKVLTCKPAPQCSFPNSRPFTEEHAPIDYKKDLDRIYQHATNRAGFQFPTALDYHEAYKKGDITPADVCGRLLTSVAHSQEGKSGPQMHFFISQDSADIIAQAEASAARYKAGKPLSVLDGVPIAIKDEFDVKGYTTTAGTKFVNTMAEEDSTMVLKLRAAGAIIVGKTNMHEIGLGVTGNNTHFGCVRNPYNPNHHTGGSSSGSGAVVGAGLVPMALGADGGGSIRIPASFCGVVGLKPTWGRISEKGAFLNTFTVGHAGPLAATAADCAAMYLAMAGKDDHDPSSLVQPQPHVRDFNKTEDLSDITIGVYWPWFRDAHPDVVKVCEHTLHKFKERGAKIKEIRIPNLELIRVAHGVTILSEMAALMDDYYTRCRSQWGYETRTSMALGRALTNMDFVRAQQARAVALQTMKELFADVTVICTPGTGCPAPEVQADSLAYGSSDVGLTSMIMKYMQIGNLTGYPGISFPAGYTPGGLPVGIQFMGNSWEEHTLLRLANAGQNIVHRERPVVFYDLLHNNTAAEDATGDNEEDVHEELPASEAN